MQRTRYRSAQAFGERVRQRRLEVTDEEGRVLSQERLADRSGLHRTYVGHVERGEVNIALENILRIAAALDVDPAELVQGLRPGPPRRTLA